MPRRDACVGGDGSRRRYSLRGSLANAAAIDVAGESRRGVPLIEVGLRGSGFPDESD
jgi:hypothetical protein